jgi:hypothetical protein
MDFWRNSWNHAVGQLASTCRPMPLSAPALQNPVAQAVMAAQAGLGWRGDISADTLDSYLKWGKWVVGILAFGLFSLFKQQVCAGNTQACGPPSGC